MIHRGQRSLIDRHQVANEDNWYVMAFQYETWHARDWRSHAERDLDTCISGLIAYGLQNSSHMLLSGYATRAMYYKIKPSPRPYWLAQMVAKHTIHPEHITFTDIWEDLVRHMPHFAREHFERISSAQIELLVRPLALDSILILLRGKVHGSSSLCS